MQKYWKVRLVTNPHTQPKPRRWIYTNPYHLEAQEWNWYVASSLNPEAQNGLCRTTEMDLLHHLSPFGKPWNLESAFWIMIY